MIGRRFREYEIIGEIGEGGMGRVYLGRNIHIPTLRVALKILKDTSLKERFLREAETLSLLDHQNICQLRQFFDLDTEFVIVTQYVNGKTIAALAKEWKEINLTYIRDIFLQILSGLTYAHDMGVYHRDIKPSNVMIDQQGLVKIIDFGIARNINDSRLTATRTAVGTPEYMAPEQFMATEEMKNFALCDIYAIGICLYELCCGRLPFQDTNPYILKDKHCKIEPTRPSMVNPEIPPDLEGVILKAIAKKPAKRFQTAGEMREALASATLTRTGPPRTVITKWGKVGGWARRNRMLILLLILFAAMLALFIGIRNEWL